MKILVVCPNATDAAHVRRQTPNKKVRVVSPGHHPSDRYDVIFVTDQYRREQNLANEETRERNKRWFETSVLTRLSGPDARIIYL